MPVINLDQNNTKSRITTPATVVPATRNVVQPSKKPVNKDRNRKRTIKESSGSSSLRSNVLYSNQRIGVFIDVQNMYYSARQFYSSKVNFGEILKEAIKGRCLIRALAYVIKADIKEEAGFFEALERIGFEIRTKDLQVFFGGAKKGDWDVGIAMDILRMAPKLDTIILVSGDGDFKDLIEYVKAQGCRAEVMAFGKSTSSRLTDVADRFVDLGKDSKRFLIKK